MPTGTPSPRALPARVPARPGARGWGPSGLRGARGFTLIELGVALVLIAIVITFVTMSITNIRRADLKKAGGMMAAQMRYLYNLAIVNNTTYRLVVDMDGGKVWGEALESDDPCAQYMPESSGEQALTGLASRSDRFDDDEDEAPRPTASFAAQKDNLLAPRAMPPGIKVTGVITSHHQAAQTEGTAYIHFFPGGYAERAYIWLGEAASHEGEDDQPLVTLELQGLMGHVKRHQDVLSEDRFLRESPKE